MATTRTIRVLLDEYSPNADITAKIDGVEVFSGVLDPADPMFTFEVPMDFQGHKSLSIKVNKGIVSTIGVVGNYTLLPNPVFTPEEQAVIYDPNSSRADRKAIYVSKANPAIPSDKLSLFDDPDTPLSTLDAILIAANVTGAVTSGPSQFIIVNGTDKVFSDVEIDGVPQPSTGAGSEDWAYMIYEGSTLTAKIGILRGLETASSIDLNPVL